MKKKKNPVIKELAELIKKLKAHKKMREEEARIFYEPYKNHDHTNS